jgi:hypothetical protein
MKSIGEAVGEGNPELYFADYMFRRCDDGRVWVENEIGEGMHVSEEMVKDGMDYIFKKYF